MNSMKLTLLFFILILLQPIKLFSEELSEECFFSGRISKLTPEINLMRVKVDFLNVKYLNEGNSIEVWDEKNESKKCSGKVIARTSDYLMVKLASYEICLKKVLLTSGAYIKMYSEDLKRNIIQGKEVVSVLLKKRQAIEGKMGERNKDLLAHQVRVDAINSKYNILKQKMELEWKKEIQQIEEDKTLSLQALKHLEIRLDEIDSKLELYKVRDNNLDLDRWSLDKNYYYQR